MTLPQLVVAGQQKVLEVQDESKEKESGSRVEVMGERLLPAEPVVRSESFPAIGSSRVDRVGVTGVDRSLERRAFEGKEVKIVMLYQKFHPEICHTLCLNLYSVASEETHKTAAGTSVNFSDFAKDFACLSDFERLVVDYIDKLSVRSEILGASG